LSTSIPRRGMLDLRMRQRGQGHWARYLRHVIRILWLF